MTDPSGRDAALVARNEAMRETVRQMLTGYEAQLAKVSEMQRQLSELTGRARSTDGTVTVVVDATGALTDITFSRGAFERHSPISLAGQVRTTSAAAAQQVRARAAELTEPMRGRSHPLSDLVPGAPDLPEAPTQITPRPPVADDGRGDGVLRSESW